MQEKVPQDPVQRPAVDRRQLQHLALLARLDLPEERRAELERRLASVLEAFATLLAVDTGPPAPAAAPDPAAAGLRPDEPGPVLPREQVLANAPRTAAGCFLVPRVVEG